MSLEPSNPKVMVGLAGTLTLQLPTSVQFSASPRYQVSEGLNLAQGQAIDPDDPNLRGHGHHANHYGDLEGSQRIRKKAYVAPHQPSAFNAGKRLILRGGLKSHKL